MISIKKLKAALFAIAMLFVAIGVELHASGGQRPRPGSPTRGRGGTRRPAAALRRAAPSVVATPAKPAVLSADALKKAVLSDIILLSSEDDLLEGIQISELKPWVDSLIKKADAARLNAFNAADEAGKKEQVGLILDAFKVQQAYKQFEPLANQKTFDTQALQQFVDLYTQVIKLVQEQRAQYEAVSNKGSFGAYALQTILADSISELNLQATRVRDAQAKLAQVSRVKVQEPEEPEAVEPEAEPKKEKEPKEGLPLRPTLSGAEESVDKPEPVAAPLLVKEEPKEAVVPQNHAAALQNIQQVITLLSKKSITQNDLNKINTFIAQAQHTFADNNDVYLGLEALQEFAGIKGSRDQFNFSRNKQNVEQKIAQTWGVAKDDTKQPEYIRSLAQKIVAAFAPAVQPAAETVVSQYQSGEAPVVKQWDIVTLRQQKSQLAQAGKQNLAGALENLISWMYVVNDMPDRFVSSSLNQLSREHKALISNVVRILRTESDQSGMLSDWSGRIQSMIGAIQNAIEQTKGYDKNRRGYEDQFDYIILNELYAAQVSAAQAGAVAELATKRGNDKQKMLAQILLAHALQYKDLISAWMHDLQATMQQEHESFVPMIPYELIQAVALEDGGRSKERQDRIDEFWFSFGKGINATAGNFANQKSDWQGIQESLNFVYPQEDRRGDSVGVMKVLQDAVGDLVQSFDTKQQQAEKISYKILSLAGWSYVADRAQDLSAKSRAELLALVSKNMIQLLDKDISKMINNDEVWPMSGESLGAGSRTGFMSGFKAAASSAYSGMFGAKKGKYTALSQSGDLMEDLDLSEEAREVVSQLQELLDRMPLEPQEYTRYEHESEQRLSEEREGREERGFGYNPRRSAQSRKPDVIALPIAEWMLTLKACFKNEQLNYSGFMDLMIRIEQIALDKSRNNPLALKILAQRVVRKMAEVYVLLVAQDRINFGESELLPGTPRSGSPLVGQGRATGSGSFWAPGQVWGQLQLQQGQQQPQQQQMQPQQSPSPLVPRRPLTGGPSSLGAGLPFEQQGQLDLSNLNIEELERLREQKAGEYNVALEEIGRASTAGQDTKALYEQSEPLERLILAIIDRLNDLRKQQKQPQQQQPQPQQSPSPLVLRRPLEGGPSSSGVGLPPEQQWQLQAVSDLSNLSKGELERLYEQKEGERSKVAGRIPGVRAAGQDTMALYKEAALLRDYVAKIKHQLELLKWQPQQPQQGGQRVAETSAVPLLSPATLVAVPARIS